MSKKPVLFALAGVVVGLGLVALFGMRAHTYLADDPAACVNCHVMVPYYATWDHGSHAQRATCNDCHVPHTNFVQKWAFKATDGLGHVAAMIANDSRDVILANPRSASVIMDNCLRCHDQLNEGMATMMAGGYEAVEQGESRACWDCHRDVPHGGVNNQAATPNALTPLPPAVAPKWLVETIRD